MIRFKEFILTEVFDNPFKWELFLKHSKETIYKFGDGYRANINVYDRGKEGAGHLLRFDYKGSYNLTKRNEEPFRVYSTMLDIVDDYNKSGSMKKGDTLLFQSADARTIKVYRHLANRIARNINGTVESDGGLHGAFFIKKNK